MRNPGATRHYRLAFAEDGALVVEPLKALNYQNAAMEAESIASDRRESIITVEHGSSAGKPQPRIIAAAAYHGGGLTSSAAIPHVEVPAVSDELSALLNADIEATDA